MKCFLSLLLISFIPAIFYCNECNPVRIFPLSLKESVEKINGEDCLVFKDEKGEMKAYVCPAEGTCVNRTRVEPDISSQVHWQFPAFNEKGVKFQILPPKDDEEIPFQFFIEVSDDKSDGQVKILWKGKNWIFRVEKNSNKIREVKGSLEELQKLLSDEPDYDLIKAFQYFLDYFPQLENINDYPDLVSKIIAINFYLLPIDILDFSKIYSISEPIPIPYQICVHCKRIFCSMIVCIYCNGTWICNRCPFMVYCMDCCVACWWIPEK
ncbi:MAG: hypothetical protein WHV67_04210 [Thermoanaerobaculia bacterium]